MKLLTSIVLIFAMLSGPVAMAQVEFGPTSATRLQIEVAPVWVFPDEVRDLPSFVEFLPYMDEMIERQPSIFNSVYDAMSVLGVPPWQYSLHMANGAQILYCDEATVLAEQICRLDSESEVITDLPNFLQDTYDRELPPNGTVQIHVMLLNGDLAWRGVLGFAWSRQRIVTQDRHWQRSSCRAWALHSVSVIAHELGHCFGLQHNEDDTNYGLDLMVSHYSHYDWVKDSNLAIVRHHFRLLTENEPASHAPPRIELHFQHGRSR